MPDESIHQGHQGIQINTNPNGQVIVSGSTSPVDKWINLAITSLALIRGAAYIPTTQQPQQQQPYYDANYAATLALQQQTQTQNQNNTAGQLGAQLQNFITSNFTLLAIGAGIFLLYKSGRK